MLKIKKEFLKTHEVLLDVVFEEGTLEKAMQKAARAISRDVNIRGFRKGRIPYKVLVRHVGEDRLQQEAINHLLKEVYPKIIEEADISPYGPGQLQNSQLAPLSFQISVPLVPTVDLGDYQSNLRLEKTTPTASEEEITMILEQVREENAILTPLDRPAELGDQVHIDVIGQVGDRVIVDEEELEIVLDLESPVITPGFVEALVGMEDGEEKTFTLTLPEDLQQDELRGAEAEFSVDVIGVYERVLPDIDDALASTIGSFETLDELKEDIQSRLVAQKDQHSREEYRNALVDALVAQAEIRYPPAMVEDMLDDMIEETKKRLERQKTTLEQALANEGRTIESLRKDLWPDAEVRTARSLALAEFARQENITVSDEDVVAAYRDMMVSVGLPPESVGDNPKIDSQLGNTLRQSAFGRKTLDRLEQIGLGQLDADVEAEEVSPEVEAAAEAETTAEVDDTA